MKTTLMFACLVGASFAFAPFSGGSRLPSWAVSRRLLPLVVSRRDGESPPTSEEDDTRNTRPTPQAIYAKVNYVLVNATKGILVADLGDAAEDIQSAADGYQEADGVNVTNDEIRNLLQDVSKNYNVSVDFSGLFDGDGPLNVEAIKVDTCLQLLKALVSRGQELEATGDSPRVVVAAIGEVSAALRETLVDAVGIVTFEAVRPVEERSLNAGHLGKRGGRFSLGGYYGGPGNWGVRAGFSYSWGRR